MSTPPLHPVAGRPWAEFFQLARLALPLALAQAGQALMGLVDTAVVGRAGSVQLAGAALGNGIFFTLSMAGIGLMLGGDPLTSQALGAGDTGRARRLYWQGVYVSVVGGLVLTLPLAASPWILVPFGIPPDVARAATDFLVWRIPGLVPLLLFFAMRGYLQGLHRTRPMIWVTVGANVFNFFGDLLLVFGGHGLPRWVGPLRAVPAMGAGGSALATSLVTVFEVAILAAVIARIRVPSGTGALHALLPKDLRRIVRVGVPIGLHLGAEVGVFALAGFLAARFGADSLAAHQVALTYGSLTFTFAVGIGNAGSVRVGYAVGARNTPAARQAGLVAFAAGVGFMAMTASAFLLFPGALVALMTDVPSIARVAIPLLAVTAVFQISDGIQGVGAGVLRGAGDSRFTFFSNVVGHYGVGLPVALWLGFGRGLGVIGIWWGLCAGLTAVALSLLVRFLMLSSREIVPLASAH